MRIPHHKTIFWFVSTAVFFLYLLLHLGWNPTLDELVHRLNSGITLYVAIYLLYRYHPFHSPKEHKPTTRFEQSILFYAGCTLLSFTTLQDIVQSITHQTTALLRL